MERRGRELVAPGGLQNQPVGEARLADMGRDGVDRQVLSINPFWYGTDPGHAQQICEVQHAGMAKMCAAYPGRFAGFMAVALQHPELVADTFETAVHKNR